MNSRDQQLTYCFLCFKSTMNQNPLITIIKHKIILLNFLLMKTTKTEIVVDKSYFVQRHLKSNNKYNTTRSFKC